jgi:hypothetical protein
MIDNFKINFISLDDLIKAKEASGRPQDKIDVRKLKKAESLREKRKKKK